MQTDANEVYAVVSRLLLPEVPRGIMAAGPITYYCSDCGRMGSTRSGIIHHNGCRVGHALARIVDEPTPGDTLTAVWGLGHD